jgi:hypothetical protein
MAEPADVVEKTILALYLQRFRLYLEWTRNQPLPLKYFFDCKKQISTFNGKLRIHRGHKPIRVIAFTNKYQLGFPEKPHFKHFDHSPSIKNCCRE